MHRCLTPGIGLPRGAPPALGQQPPKPRPLLAAAHLEQSSPPSPSPTGPSRTTLQLYPNEHPRVLSPGARKTAQAEFASVLRVFGRYLRQNHEKVSAVKRFPFPASPNRTRNLEIPTPKITPLLAINRVFFCSFRPLLAHFFVFSHFRKCSPFSRLKQVLLGAAHYF